MSSLSELCLLVIFCLNVLNENLCCGTTPSLVGIDDLCSMNVIKMSQQVYSVDHI